MTEIEMVRAAAERMLAKMPPEVSREQMLPILTAELFEFYGEVYKLKG